jgi:hypothetical protein
MPAEPTQACVSAEKRKYSHYAVVFGRALESLTVRQGHQGARGSGSMETLELAPFTATIMACR